MKINIDNPEDVKRFQSLVEGEIKKADKFFDDNDWNPYTHKEVKYDPETERLLMLLNMCKDVDCFQVEDRIFLGNKVAALRNFIKNNPKPYHADFYVWLQDNYTELRKPI